MMRPDSFTRLIEFLGIANTHRDQLTLAEFSAIRIRRLVPYQARHSGASIDLCMSYRTIAEVKHGSGQEDSAPIPVNALTRLY